VTAAEKAATVFSGAWALAPRWAITKVSAMPSDHFGQENFCLPE
jgi:hypothetical protein